MSTIRPVATLLAAAALLLPATAQPLRRPAAPRALAPQSRPYQRSGKFVRHHGRLHVFDTQLVDQHGGKIVLRGLSLGWYSLWPRFYNPEAVQWMKQDFSCNVVRAAMGIEVGGRSCK